MKARVLAVSYAYPPLPFPRSVQVERAVHAWGRRATVICASTETTTLLGNEDSAVEVLGWPESRSLSAMRRVLERFPLARSCPDPQLPWAFRTALRGQHTNVSPDVVVSFGAPMSTHLASLSLSKHFGAPLVVHLSDPWAANPMNRRSRLSEACSGRLEQLVVNSADRVVVPSEIMRLSLIERYRGVETSRFLTIPHLPPSGNHLARPDSDGRTGKVSLVHTGNLYEGRDLSGLVRIFESVRDLHPGVLDQLRFVHVGAMSRSAKTQMRGLTRLVEADSTDARVSPESARKVLAGADVGVVIEAPITKSPYLPSKFVDYVHEGLPILAVSPQGEVSRLLSGGGGYWANAHQPRQAAGVLADLVLDARSGRFRMPGPQLLNYLDPKRIASAWNEVLDGVLTRK